MMAGGPSVPPDPRSLPPRLLPILYFAVAQVALMLAFAAIAVDPHAVAGFYYHSRMLAIVHLVTLGWITSSILGALYLVGPIAFRVTLRANRLDYAAFALVALGIAGMVTHFWIGELHGMAWSTPMAASGILLAGARLLPSLFRSRAPRAVIGHVALAFANIAGASTLGVLMAFDKIDRFLPGYVLTNVFAHAHLAAVGWASMMVVGVAYRLLPMVLPAEMPAGRRLWLTAALLQVGVTGLFVSLLLRSNWSRVWALTIVAGFAAFLTQAAWMVGHPRPRPPAIRSPDPAVLHAAAAFMALTVSCGLGLWLAFAETSEHTLRVATAYGVVGLVGFLGQLIVAMKGRLLPLFAWYWGSVHAAAARPVVSPHDMPWRPGQFIVFGLWSIGVPALAAGLALDIVSVVRVGAWCLLAAAVLDAAQAAHIISHAYQRPRERRID
jgi:hypothetical protein